MISDQQLKEKVDILTNKLQAGLFNEVIVEAKNLLSKRKHQIIYNMLSISYQSLGKFDLSIKIMKEALRKNTNNPHFLNNIGISHHKLDNFKVAEEFFKKGLEIDPKNLHILNNLGNLKKDLNLVDEAIQYYTKAINIEENLIQSQLNLGNLYNTIGKFKEAKIHFRKVLQINPNYVEAHRLISEITKYDFNNTHFKEMLDKINDQNLSQFQLSHLHFAIGKAYDDLSDYKNSFINYSKANHYLKAIQKYDIKKDASNFKIIKDFFCDYQNISIKKNLKKLIFIVGMPRSGTSLTEQIISSHRDVFGGGELLFLENIINSKILNNEKIKGFNNLKLLREALEESQDEYISKITEIDNSNKVFIDKAPLNFRYIGFIKIIFPNSVIINCTRNPVDTCWSNFKICFVANLPFTNNLNDLAQFYNIYSDLIKFWRSLFVNDIYNLDYNSMIENPDKEIKNIIKFCQLDWDENCLKHELNLKQIKTASFAQARKPIYKSAINSSKNYKGYLAELISNIRY
jgi:tetratricopeptide (TPR) repeat protein